MVKYRSTQRSNTEDVNLQHNQYDTLKDIVIVVIDLDSTTLSAQNKVLEFTLKKHLVVLVQYHKWEVETRAQAALWFRLYQTWALKMNGVRAVVYPSKLLDQTDIYCPEFGPVETPR